MPVRQPVNLPRGRHKVLEPLSSQRSTGAHSSAVQPAIAFRSDFTEAWSDRLGGGPHLVEEGGGEGFRAYSEFRGEHAFAGAVLPERLCPLAEPDVATHGQAMGVLAARVVPEQPQGEAQRGPVVVVAEVLVGDATEQGQMQGP